MSMQKLVFIGFMIATLGCGEGAVSDAGGTSSTEQGGASVAVPVGATLVPFSDGTGYARVEQKDATGNVILRGTIKDDKRVGSWTEYHPNGKVKSMVSYVDGKKEGDYVELNANGQLLIQCTYHNDLRNGVYKEFNYSNLKEERFYVDDKLEGQVTIYYPNGKVMEEGQYKNGIREGISKWYDQEGNLSIEYEYRNGELVKK